MQPISLSDQHIGILLLAFGGPKSLDEIEPFLKNIFSYRPLLPSWIDEARERYRLIGGSSPLLGITEKQAKALKLSLLKAGKEIEVYIGMRYWHPYIHETIKTMNKKGIRKVLCLILSPYSTPYTTKIYKGAVDQAINYLTEEMERVFLPSWHINPLYIEAIAEKINEGLALFSSSEKADVQIVFTAHSLPQAMVKNDPYVDQIKETIFSVMKYFENYHWYLSFQSRGRGKDNWLSPDVEEVLKILNRKGKRKALVVPIGFVSDNLETLYDLDIALKEKAKSLGILLQRSPSLNDSPKFIKALTDMILKVLDG